MADYYYTATLSETQRQRAANELRTAVERYMRRAAGGAAAWRKLGELGAAQAFGGAVAARNAERDRELEGWVRVMRGLEVGELVFVPIQAGDEKGPSGPVTIGVLPKATQGLGLVWIPFAVKAVGVLIAGAALYLTNVYLQAKEAGARAAQAEEEAFKALAEAAKIAASRGDTARAQGIAQAIAQAKKAQADAQSDPGLFGSLFRGVDDAVSGWGSVGLVVLALLFMRRRAA